MWCFTILVTVFGLSFQSEEDGQYFAQWTLMITAAIVFIILSIFVLSRKKIILTGLTNIIMLLQFSRCGLLINFSYSPFCKGYWKTINTLYFALKLFKSTQNPPQFDKLEEMGVETSFFLINAQEQLAFTFLCLGIYILIAVCIKKDSSYTSHYNLLGWAFQVLIFDLMLFAYIQFQHLSINSIFATLSSTISVVSSLACIIFLFLIIWKLCKKKNNSLIMKYFTQQFKPEKVCAFYYHPFLLFSRIIIPAVYIFTRDDPYSPYISTFFIEALILFLILIRPFRVCRNNFFSIFYLSSQALLISLPFMYDKQYFQQETLNYFLVIMTLVSIGISFIRFILDFVFFQRKSNYKIGVYQSNIYPQDESKDNTMIYVRERTKYLNPAENISFFNQQQPAVSSGLKPPPTLEQIGYSLQDQPLKNYEHKFHPSLMRMPIPMKLSINPSIQNSSNQSHRIIENGLFQASPGFLKPKSIRSDFQYDISEVSQQDRRGILKPDLPAKAKKPVQNVNRITVARRN